MENSDLPMVFIELKNKNSKIAVINVYREHRQVGLDSRPEDNEKVPAQHERFSNFVALWENALDVYDDVIVLGDMNLDLNKIQDSHNHHYKSLYYTLHDRIFSRGVKQLINRPTWTNKTILSCLDHIYSKCFRNCRLAESY